MTEHPNLAAALIAALADISIVEKGRTATIPTKGGGEYSYGYADIGDVIKLTRPALAEHGIVALTPIHADGQGLACTVILLHASGDRLDLGPFPFPHGVDARATGSMVTYHRRYALVAALGIAAGDDDDGAAATARREAPHVSHPAHVEDLLTLVGDLTDEVRTELRGWLAENGLPDRPAKMDEAQAAAVVAHIRGLGAVRLVEATEADPSPNPPKSPEEVLQRPEGFDREQTARWLDQLDDVAVADLLNEYGLPGTGTKVGKRQRVLDHLESEAGARPGPGQGARV